VVLADSRLDDKRHQSKGAAACWHRVTVSRRQATRWAEDEESRAACLTVRSGVAILSYEWTG
jgi:hypothetical protein